MSTKLSRMPSRISDATAGLLAAAAVIVTVAGGFARGQQSATGPLSADALYKLGLASLSEKKYTEAEEAFRKVSELEPANSRGIMGVAEVYIAQKRADDAIRLLQAEAAKDPNRRDYHMLIGDVAVRTGKYDLALTEFLGLLNRIDKFSKAAGDLYFRVGEVYRLKGNLDFSLIFLRQAKEFLPGNAAVLTALASALESSGQGEAAVQEYRGALLIDPNNVRALNNLAFLLCEKGVDLDLALEYARRAVQLRPTSLAISDTMGWVLLKKDMTEEAIKIFRDLVQKDPTISAYHYHLAVALEKKGDRAAAMEQFKTALKSSPSKDEEHKIRELMQKIEK